MGMGMVGEKSVCDQPQIMPLFPPSPPSHFPIFLFSLLFFSLSFLYEIDMWCVSPYSFWSVRANSLFPCPLSVPIFTRGPERLLWLSDLPCRTAGQPAGSLHVSVDVS